MKPHEFRELVNELRDTAAKYHDHQSLRERIVHVLRAHEVFPDAQPTPSVPDGWLRAIDEALVTAHIGVANAEDTYEQAKAKLDSLIGWHTDVATDPAVNGGYRLIPIEPTEDMLRAMTDPFVAINGDNRKAFEIAYTAMLAAAPEAKP